jgi:hypothetical protein
VETPPCSAMQKLNVRVELEVVVRRVASGWTSGIRPALEAAEVSAWFTSDDPHALCLTGGSKRICEFKLAKTGEILVRAAQHRPMLDCQRGQVSVHDQRPGCLTVLQ